MKRLDQIRQGLEACKGQYCDECPYYGMIYCEDAVKEDAAEAIGILEELKARYPEGFDPERSINRDT